MSCVRAFTDEATFTMLDRLYAKDKIIPTYYACGRYGYTGGTRVWNELRARWMRARKINWPEQGEVPSDLSAKVKEVRVTAKAPRPEPISHAHELTASERAVREYLAASRRVGLRGAKA